MAHVPNSIPPVAITLFGLFSCLCIPLLILRGAREDDPLFSLSCAAATYVYMVADHLDGMQAIRARSGTYRGAILDHLCDFINGCLIMLGAFWMTGTSVSTLIVVSICYILAFSISHLEVAVRGELRLGAIGPLEALIIGVFFFITMSTAPVRNIWETRVAAIGDVPAYWLIIGYLVYKFAAVTWSAVNRMHNRIPGQYITFACLVGILGLQGLMVFSDTSAALLVWAAMAVYAAGYVLKLLVAEPGKVPVPGFLVPPAVTIGVLSYSALDVPVDLLIWLLFALTAGIITSLVVSSWQLPQSRIDVA